MSDLRELYQEAILDHNKRPRNHGALTSFTHRAQGFNPLCGDRITVYLRIEQGVVAEIGFEGYGCAISTASASLMTEAVQGLTLAQVQARFAQVHAMLTDTADPPAPVPDDLGGVEVFAGVRLFPARVKCASLSWHAVCAAIDQRQGAVRTE